MPRGENRAFLNEQDKPLQPELQKKTFVKYLMARNGKVSRSRIREMIDTEEIDPELHFWENRDILSERYCWFN